VIWVIKKIINLRVWRRLFERFFAKKSNSIVEFYQRLISILEAQGLKRQAFQTPLEFAYAVDLPEVLTITEWYQEVRFGKYDLTREEANEISVLLERLEKRGKAE
ncbi:MAG TPA: DUF4129 domain-containing protein, partial [Pyrinomonadaceae bacterium]|nr:DUF4129 domain-containing protein [Pyrinomonadaceae bacterium]